jgi:hypothetical protein
VGEFENELVDYSVDPQSAANKLQIGVIRVAKDETVPIEVCQWFTSNTTS